jgi:hypothetical protein
VAFGVNHLPKSTLITKELSKIIVTDSLSSFNLYLLEKYTIKISISRSLPVSDDNVIEKNLNSNSPQKIFYTQNQYLPPHNYENPISKNKASVVNKEKLLITITE